MSAGRKWLFMSIRATKQLWSTSRKAYNVSGSVRTNRNYITIRNMSQEAKILRTEDVQPGDAKWLKLQKIQWQDQEGKERTWETANRSTRSKGGVDAVAILALLNHPSRPLSTIIIEQYRPPVGSTCIELPAGLIDEGESPETTALRELHEETGYGAKDEAKVKNVSSILVNDPGMSGANMHLVTIDVTLSENDEEPEQKLEPGEHIIKRIVPLEGLYNRLQDYGKKGFSVDARLAHFALGWQMSNEINKK